MSPCCGGASTSSTLRKILILWMLSLLFAIGVSEKSHSALSVVEDSGSVSNGDEEAHVNDDLDDEDFEVFQPTSQWQTLKPGQAVPAGSHVRLNLQTGQREAKLGEEQQAKYLKEGQRVVNTKAPSFTAQELKEALKMFKEGVEDPKDPQKQKEEEALKARFRPLEELKRDLAELDMVVETDVQVMHRLIAQFNSSSATVEQRVKALIELEYLVHQVDNAQNLVSMGGMKLVINALNCSDLELRESAAFVLGSAVSSNPSVQVEAVEGGALQKLLAILATPHPMSVKKKALFAVAALLRHFPHAQGHFLKLGGMQVLVNLFQTPGGEGLRIRIITLIYDMIVEKELMLQSGLDQIPDSSHQERVRQYAQVTLLPVLAEQGWCRLVPEQLASVEHDWREKVLRTLLALMPRCKDDFRQNHALGHSLSDLQKQYRELAHTERNLGEEDGYFGEILSLVDTVVLKIR